MAPWVASALAFLLTFRPRFARFLAGTFVIVTISDFLQHVYGAAKGMGR